MMERHQIKDIPYVIATVSDDWRDGPANWKLYGIDYIRNIRAKNQDWDLNNWKVGIKVRRSPTPAYTLETTVKTKGNKLIIWGSEPNIPPELRIYCLRASLLILVTSCESFNNHIRENLSDGCNNRNY